MKQNTKALVYGALAMALSFALSYVKLFSMPMGGSVTLCSMLPLMVYAYRFGPRWGLLAGLAYGFLQLLQKPEIVHWLQLVMDYPLAYMALGLAALPKRRLPLGIALGGAGRFLCHAISGAVFFAAYAPEGMNVWLYTVLYNGGYLGAETAICILVCLIPPVRRAIDRL